MGLLKNPSRLREGRLPLYQKPEAPIKERNSNDDYYYSDDDSDASTIELSGRSSRSVSDSLSSSSVFKAKRSLTKSKTSSRSYPYRLPSRVTRYFIILVVGTTILMILSLIRASQVENWKLANGKQANRPAPAPVWEKFPFLERYYGGIRSLKPFNESQPEYPNGEESVVPTSSHEASGQKPPEKRMLPVSNSWAKYANKASEKEVRECFIDAESSVRVPQLHYYNGRPQGFPQHVGGSYEELGLPDDICFERFGRYGPYGFGYSTRRGGLGTGELGENEGAELVWDQVPHVSFRTVNWADVQRRCFYANAERYSPSPARQSSPDGFYITNDASGDLKTEQKVQQGDKEAIEERTDQVVPNTTPETVGQKTSIPDIQKNKTARTAVVVRCWDEFFFREDDVANLRSLVTELSLTSGGRYDIHLLVQVKNDAKYPIWADSEVYQKRINDTIPEEFRGMVTMWTETQMLALYQGIYDVWSRGPDLPVHGAYRGLSMAIQHFAYMHPEYDYYWQWEMDVRYTGHYYDLLNKVEAWAKAQPRKGLWERNARFYVPSVHGSWEDFSQMARVQSEMGTTGADNIWKNLPGAEEGSSATSNKKETPVWGPVRPADDNDWFQHDEDPLPPTTYEKDRYTWGVGEEADYITLSPIFNPEGTSWGLKDDITGFNRSHPLPPRRASIITTSRLSRRLLMTMHKMTAFKKQFAFPEMWPATVSLQHGFKAVYVPHPIYVDRKWPVEFLANTLNGGSNGATGGSRTSVYGDREHNLKGLTWFYNAGFAPNIYRRWLGLKVNNDGGDAFERTVDDSEKGHGVENMPGGEGRMCLPPMLLHPVKNVELPVETPEEQGEEKSESDPAA